jgi:hypothetical protein
LPSGNFNRTLRYLDAIDAGEDGASRMAFYSIAGNEENLRRWESKLCDQWRMVERVQDGDRVIYRKTDLGQSLHRLLKNHAYVGSLFEELIRDRLR